MNPVDSRPTEGTNLCSEEGGTIYFVGIVSEASRAFYQSG